MTRMLLARRFFPLMARHWEPPLHLDLNHQRACITHMGRLCRKRNANMLIVCLLDKHLCCFLTPSGAHPLSFSLACLFACLLACLFDSCLTVCLCVLEPTFDSPRRLCCNCNAQQGVPETPGDSPHSVDIPGGCRAMLLRPTDIGTKIKNHPSQLIGSIARWMDRFLFKHVLVVFVPLLPPVCFLYLFFALRKTPCLIMSCLLASLSS